MAQLDNKKLIKFLALLGREFSKRLSKEKAAQLLSFTKLYYASTPLDELINRNIEDAYGATLSSWNFMQDYSDDSLAKINIYNPDYEHHGWSSTHTIVTILQQDIPFLVDSLRIELNRQNIIIHTMVNRTYQVARDQHGRLQQVSSSEDKGLPKARKESIIYLEIDRRTSQEINSLRTSLQSVFTEVRQVVSHHGKMLEQAKQLVNTLEKTNLKKDNKFQVKSTDISETITFLQWLIEGHFVFLGYSQNQIQETKPAFTTKPGLALGLLDQEVNESLAVDNKELVAERLSATQPLIFAKFAERCRVHRPAYPDYISIKCYDSDGNPIQEHIFLGLLTSAAYTQDPWSIPILRHKVQSVLQQARLPANGHDGKELVQILKNYPRDELFQMSSDELFNASVAILHLQERRTTKLFIRKDSYGSFFTCLVFLPRDVFGTELRLKVQDILCTALGAKDIEFDTRYSDSILVRIRYRIRIDPQHLPDYDITELADGIREAAISWDEQLYDALIESFGEERGNHLAKTYTGAFSASYREDFSPRTAVADISHGEILTAGEELAMSFYHALEEEENIYRFKVFHAGDPLPLSDVLPIIENLGLRVEAARPYAVRRNAARQLWINDFSLVYGDRELIDIQKVKDILQDAFAKTWLGDAENDGFNRLVLAAHLNWRQIAMLRGYAKYLKQIGFPFSQRYIGTTLCKHASTSRLLVALFTLRFMPSRSRTQAEEQKLVSRVLASLETVESLDEDRILRRYLEVIQATLRTNFYQKTNQADYKPYIAFKLDSQAIPEIPLPCPLYEIFVNAPWVEGVHLRSGKVARGGLRWSDRPEDFRTEILGLVKAQQVKNAVIVPAGAKGGFIAKKLPENGTREELLAEGIRSYKTFICGLLDITDNLVDGQVQSPAAVVCKDEADPYLVVAADKGTATFSDTANELAKGYNFWLGDAFASGGSAGYDHKKIGITARGAWVSVQRHFRELGIHTQKQPFRVIGVGDMSGDVFGNGMLLSKQILLVAAFNHQHIFLDPNPDAAISYQERQRLFNLPRSSWTDYDSRLISAGGRIYSRQAKSISLSKEVKQCLNTRIDRLTPNQLISLLLKAPVDLIWNAGIGTYVKASSELNVKVGDKANDGIRVDGRQLRCRVYGEGGNLGMTQLGRVEFALQGGHLNTDAIDNSAGVDCSDHEVNIKILLNELVATGDLTNKQRDQLLVEMTEVVAELVLRNNYRQTQLISVCLAQVDWRIEEYRHLMLTLIEQDKLDPELEFLPSSEVIFARMQAKQQPLTRPELSVLVAYCKLILKESLVNSAIIDDPYVAKELEGAFPAVLVERFADALYQHRLRREIIATQIANNMLHRVGISFVQRLQESTGAEVEDITSAYVISRETFAFEAIWQQLEQLDYQVDAKLQLDMMASLMSCSRYISHWFLRNRRSELKISPLIADFAPGIKALLTDLPNLLCGTLADNWQTRRNHLVEQQVPEQLANFIAAADTGILYHFLGIITASQKVNASLVSTAKTYFALGEALDIYWFGSQLKKLPVNNNWQTLARENYRSDLDWQQQSLTVAILKAYPTDQPSEANMNSWISRQQYLFDRWQRMLADIRATQQPDFAMFSVALRELLDLAQASNQALAYPKPEPQASEKKPTASTQEIETKSQKANKPGKTIKNNKAEAQA